MNSGTAIALMVIGAVLILTPLVLGFEMREHAMAAYAGLVASGHTIPTSHPARGGRLYALVCLIAGLACLVIGIVRSRELRYPPTGAAIHRPAA